MFVKTYLCVERDGGDVELTKNMYYTLSMHFPRTTYRNSLFVWGLLVV
jgi:hypothetical protein